jgi:hypothetical protein
MALRVVAVSFKQACQFIAEWHRHHKPPRGHKFSIGAARDDELVGVAVVGRPVARHYDDGRTLEVTRCCVADDARNACSFLYAAARRVTFALGYDRLITYTQDGESGDGLRGAGWRVVASRPATPGWDRPSRPRELRGTENVQRLLWAVTS